MKLMDFGGPKAMHSLMGIANAPTVVEYQTL